MTASRKPNYSKSNGHGELPLKVLAPEEAPRRDDTDDGAPPPPPIDDDPSSYHTPDDDQLAIDLAEEWKDKVAFFHGDWHVYAKGVWSTREQEEVEQSIRKFLRPYRRQRVKVKQALISSLVKMMRADMYMPDRTVNRIQAESVRYINMRNGLYDIETHTLSDHRPDLLMVNQLDFDYDPDATCPAFDEFLHTSLVLPDSGNQTDHDMVALVQQALGYSMTARTDLKTAFWLKGVPNSGKSTLLALIRGMMGDLSTSIDLNQLATKTFMLSEIIGKRVVTFPEAAEGQMLPDAIFKTIVGGSDEVWADVKGSKGIRFVPVSKIWWAMNGMPRISDRSGAAFARLKLILFNRTFSDSERDTTLLSRLLAERSGIFNSLMHHYEMLSRNGWRRVEQSERVRAQYELENDTEKTFVEQCCQCDPRNNVRSSELYAAYKDWCDRGGFKPKNLNQIAADWRRLGFVDKRSNGIVWWGVRLTTINDK